MTTDHNHRNDHGAYRLVTTNFLAFACCRSKLREGYGLQRKPDKKGSYPLLFCTLVNTFYLFTNWCQLFSCSPIGGTSALLHFYP